MNKSKESFTKMLAFIREAPFWLLLLLMFGIELFVVKPMGSIVSTAIFFYWICANRNAGNLMYELRRTCSAWRHGSPERSLWYDNEGCTEILKLVERLTREGKNYCNLAEEIKLPPFEHWNAISKGLNDIGITTQFTATSFFIKWQQPTASEK